MKSNLDECRRDLYRLHISIPTRWNDYDLLGHVNNVLYNRYFEIVVLELVKLSGVNWMKDSIVPYAAEVCCKFLRPLGYCETIDAALRVGRLGNTSAVYELALYMPEESNPSAIGHFVHVFVDRKTEQPVPIPESVRSFYAQYVTSQ